MNNFAMLKFLLSLFILGTVFNIILPVTEAYGHEHQLNSKSDTINNGESYDTAAHNLGKEYEKLNKKKYYKKGEEKYLEKEKSSYKDGKHWEQKKHKEYKRYANYNNLDDSPKSGKYSKYEERQNHYENPAKNKETSYHDKNVKTEKPYQVKAHVNEQEITEPEPVSLHHDIDVNYLNNHKTLAGDAEFIDVERNIKTHVKKAYMQNANYIDEKKGRNNFYKNMKELDLTHEPVGNNSALIARFIIHNVDWTAMGTISTNSKLKGGPFVNVISMSDGPVHKGSGVPFFYMTPKDFSSIDAEKDNRCSITATLAQTDICKKKNYDPESPLCARLILAGKLKKIKPNTEEENFARLALFSRHPEMEKWPADHDWFLAKLKIKQIILINHFGGASYISIQDYFDA